MDLSLVWDGQKASPSATAMSDTLHQEEMVKYVPRRLATLLGWGVVLVGREV